MLGTIASQSTSGVPETVTKSAVRNTLRTPSSARIGATLGSASSAFVYVTGPPTALPTMNFIAAGFGVRSTVTGMPSPPAVDGSGVAA